MSYALVAQSSVFLPPCNASCFKKFGRRGNRGRYRIPCSALCLATGSRLWVSEIFHTRNQLLLLLLADENGRERPTCLRRRHLSPVASVEHMVGGVLSNVMQCQGRVGALWNYYLSDTFPFPLPLRPPQSALLSPYIRYNRRISAVVSG